MSHLLPYLVVLVWVVEVAVLVELYPTLAVMVVVVVVVAWAVQGKCYNLHKLASIPNTLGHKHILSNFL